MIRPKASFPGLGKWIGQRSAHQVRGIADQVSIRSNPPDLAAQVLAIPRVPAILLSDPKPEIELKGRELRLDRIGSLPQPRAAKGLFDVLCAIAELIEQQPGVTSSVDPVEASGAA
ncbi:MAG: hypothetical protein GTO14_12655 [Anaerolineales bacterium]|nr:hypothetical protein [Anaerolineales bacterium]